MTEHRAPVQAAHCYRTRRLMHGPGTVEWHEHIEAWCEYARRFGCSQTPDRIAERGGFGYVELTDLLGHEPVTWRPLESP
jgi:hypothetical protein